MINNSSRLTNLILKSIVNMGMKIAMKNFRAIASISNMMQATLKCANYCTNPVTTKLEICCANRYNPYSKVFTRHLYLTEKIKLNLNEGCITR